ncbi:MAG: hypothetical protein Q7K40_02205 [bacterium]|nr:hypothetical protein [bacterium]
MKNCHSSTIYVDGKYVTNPDYIHGCEGTRLIQRLKLPQKESLPAFGGGLKHGGLSEKAWEIISAICSFDAMGASEFEMGALPEAIQKLNDGFMNLEAYPLTVSGNPNFSLSGKFQEYESSAREMIRKDHKLGGDRFCPCPTPYPATCGGCYLYAGTRGGGFPEGVHISKSYTFYISTMGE